MGKNETLEGIDTVETIHDFFSDTAEMLNRAKKAPYIAARRNFEEEGENEN